MHKSPPAGWPRISAGIFYDDADKAVDWLCRAFGFETRLRVEADGGGILHSELVFGEGVIMVGSASRGSYKRSPRALQGANTQYLMVYVDDVDEHCSRARNAGASIIMEPETKDYGDDWGTNRSYEAEDCEGHRWWFTQRLIGGHQSQGKLRIHR